jgi:ribonuclease I
MRAAIGSERFNAKSDATFFTVHWGLWPDAKRKLLSTNPTKGRRPADKKLRGGNLIN